MTLGEISKQTFTFVLLIALLFLPGCFDHAPGVMYITVLDITASIDPAAEAGMFASVDLLARQLHRGDSLTIILVTGDVQADAPGRVLHYEASQTRETYDADLKNLATRIDADIEAEKRAALEHPANQTDLLGAVSLSVEQSAARPGARRYVLLILSDFLQDDREFDFSRVTQLADNQRAARFAEELAHSHHRRLPAGTLAYLGLLRSCDYASLSKGRRQALETFWMHYLTLLGAQPTFATDGPGLLNPFFERAQNSTPAPK
jgi:hypothetical protein